MGRKQCKGFVFEQINECECYISDYRSNVLTETLIIPEVINGLRVVKINTAIFVDAGMSAGDTEVGKSKQAIREVVIPDTVIEIIPTKNDYCCKAEKIHVPAHLSAKMIDVINYPSVREFVASNDGYYNSVDGVLFTKDMSRLIRYPAGKLGHQYFIPKGTIVICEEAFLLPKTSELTTVQIPATVKEIEDSAFWTYCAKDILVEFEENNVEKIGQRVFTCFADSKCPKVNFGSLKEYKGNAFTIGSMENVSLSSECEIVYSEGMDYREYLYYSIRKMLVTEELSNDIKIYFLYGDKWYDGKYSDHHFETVVERNHPVNSEIKEKMGKRCQKLIEVDMNRVIYRFDANPQKSHYEEQKYRQYLDDVKKMIDLIK